MRGYESGPRAHGVMWISAKRTAADDVAFPSKPRMPDRSVHPSAPGPRESDPRWPCCASAFLVCSPHPGRGVCSKAPIALGGRSGQALRSRDVVVCTQGADRARRPVRAGAPLMGASVRAELVTPLIENQESAAAV